MGDEEQPAAVNQGLAPQILKPHFQISQPKPMEITKGNLADNWIYFKETWENYATATRLDKEEPKIIAATLLNTIGRETMDIVRSLTINDKTDPEQIKTALENHFIPKKNVTYERYVFNTTSQEELTIDAYVTKLQQLSSSCEFGQLRESLVRDRLVVGVRDDSLRERLLREGNLGLNEVLQLCRASERTAEQLRVMKKEESVHKVTKQKTHGTRKPEVDCAYCGTHHQKKKCPAWHKRCSKCNKWNHLASVCQAGESSTSKSSEPQSRSYRHKSGRARN